MGTTIFFQRVDVKWAEHNNVLVAQACAKNNGSSRAGITIYGFYKS